METILIALMVALVIIIIFGNSLLWFGEDSQSPLMKTLTLFLVLVTASVFVVCLLI